MSGELDGRGMRNAYNNLAKDSVILSFYIYGGLVCLLHAVDVTLHKEQWRIDRLTISSSTSPAEKASPSCFFHSAIPPSVIVGDIAGICKFVTAWRTADICIPARHEW